MPTSKDPFITVNDRGKSSTVIRKGSPYAKRFARQVQDTEKTYSNLDAKQGNVLKENFPAANARIDRGAARQRGADVVAGAAKDIAAGRMKVGDMTGEGPRTRVTDVLGQDERTKYAK